jgi:MFS family permease
MKPGRRRTTILLAASAVTTATMVGTGLIRSFWVTVPIFLLGALAGGVLAPVRQTYLHQSIPTSERATLVSFDSLMGSLGSVGGQTGLGYLSQERSIPAGFVIGGLVTIFTIPIFARLRGLNEPADFVTATETARDDIPPEDDTLPDAAIRP